MVGVHPALGEVPYGWSTGDVRALEHALPVSQRIWDGASDFYRLSGGDGRTP